MNFCNISDIINSNFLKDYFTVNDQENAWIYQIAIVGTIAVTALALIRYINSPAKPRLEIEPMNISKKKKLDEDLTTIKKIAREIYFQKISIQDAGAYTFTFNSDAALSNTTQGSISYQASFSRAIQAIKTENGSQIRPSTLRHKLKKALNTPEEILHMGQDLLNTRSGQCDHMAAAVIAKIVDHIKAGGEWNSEVEIVGNGRHAFAIINHGKDGTSKDLETWDKETTVVDLWLGSLGVKKEYRQFLSPCHFGVISDENDVRNHRNAFRYSYLDEKTNAEVRLTSRCIFTPETLRNLAERST